MPKTIRIGTRDSQLAMWQAKTVQAQLEHLGQLQVDILKIFTGQKEVLNDRDKGDQVFIEGSRKILLICPV